MQRRLRRGELLLVGITEVFPLLRVQHRFDQIRAPIVAHADLLPRHGLFQQHRTSRQARGGYLRLGMRQIAQVADGFRFRARRGSEFLFQQAANLLRVGLSVALKLQRPAVERFEAFEAIFR